MQRLHCVYGRADQWLIVLVRVFSLFLLLLFICLPVEKGWASVINQCIRPDGERIFRNAPCQKGEQSKPMPSYPTRSTANSASPEIPIGPVEIPLLAESRPGKYWVEVKLNNAVKVKFLVDTGADNLLVPEEVFDDLQRSGLATQDHMGTGKYKIADGSVVESREFHLHEIAMGGRRVEHVIASIGKRGVTPLFGSNVLERFGKWHIDVEKKSLVLEEQEGEKQTDRDAAVMAACREQKDRIDNNIIQINRSHDEHNQEVERLQNVYKQIQGERRVLVHNALVKQYNADVEANKEKHSVRMTNRTELLEDSKRQSEHYNKRCPGRLYQGANGVWQRFFPIQVTSKNDSHQ